jgi:hypothetical protein
MLLACCIVACMPIEPNLRLRTRNIQYEYAPMLPVQVTTSNCCDRGSMCTTACGKYGWIDFAREALASHRRYCTVWRKRGVVGNGQEGSQLIMAGINAELSASRAGLT